MAAGEIESHAGVVSLDNYNVYVTTTIGISPVPPLLQ